MSHTIDVNRLPEIFEALKDNVHKLDSWQCDRLEEWSEKYERSKGKWIPSEAQLEKIEEMYLKV